MLTRDAVRTAKAMHPKQVQYTGFPYNCGPNVVSAHSLFSARKYSNGRHIPFAMLLRAANMHLWTASFCTTTSRQRTIEKWLEEMGAKRLTTFYGHTKNYTSSLWQLHGELDKPKKPKGAKK